ncbi:hypothetical protein [Dethiosulfovibrio salsuginis]|uniref:Uncharacterized protein n=1 Tax=Dethiosulfovibrio salsuginis TaxID=561720 RepID=A0A1X7LCC9_9BACT|nr:hypothetical protein [Dethiosulfovibrio salsuginis]SMG51415.1 hypothetical protein SAMN06275492_1561 [Dethiosulfovibrio salsuginis]
MKPGRLMNLYNIFAICSYANTQDYLCIVDMRTGDEIFGQIALESDCVIISKTSFCIEVLKDIYESITIPYLESIEKNSPVITLDGSTCAYLADTSSNIQSLFDAIEDELYVPDESSAEKVSDLSLKTWTYKPAKSAEREAYLVSEMNQENLPGRVICSAYKAEDASFAVLTPNVIALTLRSRDFMRCLLERFDLDGDIDLSIPQLEEHMAKNFKGDSLRSFSEDIASFFAREEIVKFNESMEIHKTRDMAY